MGEATPKIGIQFQGHNQSWARCFSFFFFFKLQFQSNTRVLVQSFSKDTNRTLGLPGQQHLVREIKVPKASNKQSQGLWLRTIQVMPLTGFAQAKNSNYFNGTFFHKQYHLTSFCWIHLMPSKGPKYSKFCNSTTVHTLTPQLKRNVKDIYCSNHFRKLSHHIRKPEIWFLYREICKATLYLQSNIQLLRTCRSQWNLSMLHLNC